MRHRFAAPTSDRLDRLVRGGVGSSRAATTALVRGGAVTVDGVVQVRPEARVLQGAVLEVRSAPAASQVVGLPEIYRDSWILVVDKPAGMPTQPTREGGGPNLHGLLAAQERYVGLHHRLDQPASGLVLVSLDPAANAGLSRAFREHQVRRSYLAVVLGDPGGAGRWCTPVEGQVAATRWTRLATAGGMSLLSLELETGRGHQIRIHALDAGFPIVGDRRHGGAVGRAWPRLALHAAGLELAHPVSGAALKMDSSIPADLLALIVRTGWCASEIPPGSASDGETAS